MFEAIPLLLQQAFKLRNPTFDLYQLIAANIITATVQCHASQ